MSYFATIDTSNRKERFCGGSPRCICPTQQSRSFARKKTVGTPPCRHPVYLALPLRPCRVALAPVTAQLLHEAFLLLDADATCRNDAAHHCENIRKWKPRDGWHLLTSRPPLLHFIGFLPLPPASAISK